MYALLIVVEIFFPDLFFYFFFYFAFVFLFFSIFAIFILQTSGFDHYWKSKWLGETYTRSNGVKANCQDRTNISQIRTHYRHTNLLRELNYVAKLSVSVQNLKKLKMQLQLCHYNRIVIIVIMIFSSWIIFKCHLLSHNFQTRLCLLYQIVIIR